MSQRPERRSSGSKYQSGASRGSRSWRTMPTRGLAGRVEVRDEARRAGARAPPAPPGRGGAWRDAGRRSSSSPRDAGSGLISRARTASRAGTSPANSSKRSPLAGASPSVSASTSATSSRGTGPRRPSSVETSTRPVPGSSCRLPGRTIVQSSGSPRRGRPPPPWRAGTGASPPAPPSGSWAPIEETITNRATPSSSAASTHFTAAPRSTVRLRSAPEPGPGARGEHDRVGAATWGRRPRARGRTGRRRRRRPRGRRRGPGCGSCRGPCGRRREQADQVAGDLPVAAGDQHVHAGPAYGDPVRNWKAEGANHPNMGGRPSSGRPSADEP